ncbi:hypothetical protein C7R88_08700 [Plesiomonas shigelloides]|nr:hypothetical protein C7R88_08700 [Plesiomonas shigelloides]
MAGFLSSVFCLLSSVFCLLSSVFCLLSVFLLMRFSGCKKTTFLFIPISSPLKVTFEQRMYGLCCGYVRAREVNSLRAISPKYGFRANKADYSRQL